jgi:hypothetical protein
MVTAADLATIAALHGAAFDQAVRDTLREHLGQGAWLAAAELANGRDPRTRRLAALVEAARKAELGRLPA